MCSNTGHWPPHQHRMVKQKSILAEEYDVHDFQSTRTVPCNYLPWWRLGMPLRILAFQLTVKCMHPWPIHQPLKRDPGMHCLNISTAADVWWQEHVWPIGHRCACVQSTPHKLLVSPSCWWGYSKRWRDSDFCSHCHAWDTVYTFKDRFHLLHVAFVHRQHCGYTVEGHCLSLLVIHNGIHPSANSLI